MAINLKITTNGAGVRINTDTNFKQSSTFPTALTRLENGIYWVIFVANSREYTSKLSETQLNGTLLNQDPEIAADQLAQAGFKTAPGGSGADTNAFVDFGTTDKANGVIEHIERSGQITIFNDGTVTPAISVGQTDDRANVNSNIYSLNAVELFGQGGNVYQQEVIYYVDKPYGNIYPHLGSGVLAMVPSTSNSETAAYSLIVSQLNGYTPVNRPLFNISNGFNNSNEEVFKIDSTGQLKLNNYTGANFDGEGQFLTVDSNGNVQKSTGSTLTGISFFTRNKGVLSSSVVISTTPVDLTPILGSLTQTISGGLITYDSVNGVFKADPATTTFYNFKVTLRLSGNIQGGGTSSYIFDLRRPNGTDIITTEDYSRIGGTGDLINTQVLDISTRVFSGGSDSYQTDGFKIYGRNIDGQDLTLTNGVNDFQELILER